MSVSYNVARLPPKFQNRSRGRNRHILRIDLTRLATRA